MLDLYLSIALFVVKRDIVSSFSNYTFIYISCFACKRNIIDFFLRYIGHLVEAVLF